MCANEFSSAVDRRNPQMILGFFSMFDSDPIMLVRWLFWREVRGGECVPLFGARWEPLRQVCIVTVECVLCAVCCVL